MATTPPPDSYLTLATQGDSDFRVQKSRFIGVAAPATDEEAARAHVADMARRYHDSRHVCFGWRLGSPPGFEEHRTDAGEPSGTAGEPILTAIRKRDLSDTVVVVVRYFGGTKLGTGGLQRAYGQAADLALDQARIRKVLLGRHFQVAFSYPFQKTMQHLLDGAGGKITAEEYTEQVRWRIWVPHSAWANLETALTEASAGSVTLEPRDGGAS